MEGKVFGSHMKEEPQPLNWATRIMVAIGSTRGHAFLHDAKEQVIYLDFKASNILLGPPLYFDLAKAETTGDRTHVSTQVMERRAMDNTKVGIEQNLVASAKPYLGDKHNLFRIVDTKLEGQYPQKGAYTAANLDWQCLSNEPKLRAKNV
ncbi:hypothetical protein RDI58_017688 [Solanum bulbocastanum]|uniref:Protein kinase domain-containing protein n=1 Tax=Solanum bulbocastanum TaxID=147425 RepID=A0AAN8TCS7_SOLBU